MRAIMQDLFGVGWQITWMVITYAGCMVVFAVDMNRRMMELRGRNLPMWTTHYADSAVQPQSAEWLCPRPGRDVLARSERNAMGEL